MSVTLEEIDQVVAGLPTNEQVEIARRIGRRVAPLAANGPSVRKWSREEVDAFLGECDALADSIPGSFDSAEDIRAMREERMREIA